MGTDREEDSATAACPVPGTGPSSPSKTMAAKKASEPKPMAHGEIDLEAWRGDLRRLHITLDTAVQAFIGNQTQQLDAVVCELAAQKDRIFVKEQSFAELADSIAGFVETEAARTELWGLPIVDAEADARHEVYDAELPGPPALHRINRLWRKMTRAFEVMKEAKTREASQEVSDEKERLEALVRAADERLEKLQSQHKAEVEALRLSLESANSIFQEKEGNLDSLSAQLQTVTDERKAMDARVAEMAECLEQSNATRSREEYEWDAEREELIREQSAAFASSDELRKCIEASKEHEAELIHLCAERGDKLEQMKKIMDDQEHEMTMKIDRVQQYVKERQASALVAEKKQQDAEKLADRWQREVQRLQSEKDRLAAVVLEIESHKSSQVMQLHGSQEVHEQEVHRLQEGLRQKEEEMRSTNDELNQKREAEYQNKIMLERQREKDRSIALLNKKHQEMLVKDQQLKAARQRIQELESGNSSSASTATPDSARGSSSGGRRSPKDRDSALPPLPMSAR